MKTSLFTLLICFTFMMCINLFYYPKWKSDSTEATIGWDVSGYYMYLPAAFIYKDIKKCNFLDSIVEKYSPTPDVQQGFRDENGNFIMKYSLGQAVMYLPFFAVAHIYASATGQYPADGFSTPYQFFIIFGCWIYSFIGLWYLRKVLLEYFSDAVTAITIGCIVLATNYLVYATINAAMTHCEVFMLYSILLYHTIQFYKKESFKNAAVIGISCGLAALTRPTEVISVIIPVLWGVNIFSFKSISERISFIFSHFSKYFIAGLLFGIMGSLQLIYWKYVSGHWVVYSYRDQGFSWLHPHLQDGLFSFRSGWLLYTPIMYFAWFGFVPFFKKQKDYFGAAFLFCVLFTYIAFAWDEWWYGASVGQRCMVQAYPVFALPFAAFVAMILNTKKWLYIGVFGIFAFFGYYNIWLCHQSYRGGLMFTGQMTKPYFKKIFLTYKKDPNNEKLLDTKYLYDGEISNATTLYTDDFEKDTSAYQGKLPVIEGKKSVYLDKEHQWSKPIFIPFKNESKNEWLRVSADFKIGQREWNSWWMTQFIVRLYSGDTVVRESMIRVHRFLDENEPKNLNLDLKIPKDKTFDRIAVLFWNANNHLPIVIDNVKVVGF